MDDYSCMEIFERVKELGGISLVHCENGDAVAYNQKKLLEAGVTGPEAHLLSRSKDIEGEGTHRMVVLGIIYFKFIIFLKKIL